MILEYDSHQSRLLKKNKIFIKIKKQDFHLAFIFSPIEQISEVIPVLGVVNGALFLLSAPRAIWPLRNCQNVMRPSKVQSL